MSELFNCGMQKHSVQRYPCSNGDEEELLHTTI